MKYRKRILLCSLFVILLGGCGKEDAIYNTEASKDINQSEVVETEGVSKIGGNLAEQLGITDTVWKETISADGKDVYVNATIQIPEVSDMHTLDVSEHYYTPEEKKKLVEYFMGTDNVKVNTQKVPTKEWAKERIEYCDGVIKDEYNANQKSYVRMFENEKDRLEEWIGSLPSKEDVSDVVTDYSEDHYICTKDGVEYTLSFDMSEEENRSSWSMVALDEKKFPDKRLYPFYSPGYNIYRSNDSEDNLSVMTKEEACEKAEAICSEIGLADMKVASVQNLFIHGDMSATQSHYNGYYIVLARAIKGVIVDDQRYYEKEIYLDTDVTMNSYEPERVIIVMDDDGLIEMTYTGCLETERMGSAVKLLEYNQIQEIFKKELEKFETESNTLRGLSLEYVRVMNEAEPNQYSYIPAWRLSVQEPYDELTEWPAYYDIWLNAIDGSRIYLEEEGAICYHTADEYLEEMTSLPN